MEKIVFKTDPRVKEVFRKYPVVVRDQMSFLRQLVLQTAKETEGVDELSETLKWGEPSYLTRHGSTLRMDWKQKTPDQYALYFQCTTRLVETFRLLYRDTFQYEGNRAIVFKLDQKLPIPELKQCIKATLMYHAVKHKTFLGI